jgi:hypothetical protein
MDGRPGSVEDMTRQRWEMDHIDFWANAAPVDLLIVTAPMREAGWEPFAIENIMRRAERQATDPKTPLEDIAAVWSEPVFGKRVWFKRLTTSKPRPARATKKTPARKAKNRGRRRS